MTRTKSTYLALIAVLLSPMAANADTIAVGFTALADTTPQATGVFRADLFGLSLTELASISMTDDSGTDGSPGVWSGFDLAAIKLSRTFCTDAACANAAVGLNVFDFVNGVLFNGGTMDATANPDLQGPCLFGTSGGGCDFDDSIATLDLFDAVFSIPVASSGWVSLGRGGEIAFNLTSLVSLLDPLYLYVGEVGNNGETLSGLVEVSDVPVRVSEPGTLALLGIGLFGMGLSRRRKTV